VCLELLARITTHTKRILLIYVRLVRLLDQSDVCGMTTNFTTVLVELFDVSQKVSECIIYAPHAHRVNCISSDHSTLFKWGLDVFLETRSLDSALHYCHVSFTVFVQEASIPMGRRGRVRAENGPGGPWAGPGLKIPIFLTGRARTELPNLVPARFVSSRSCCVSRSMPRVAFPSV
jgi:hypothetical protein